MFVPTTKITILKEKLGTDDYGDTVDSYRAVQSNVPAHIYERKIDHNDPSDGRVDVVREPKCMVHAGVTVEKGYRIKDQKDDKIYYVDFVREFRSFVAPHKQLHLKIVE